MVRSFHDPCSCFIGGEEHHRVRLHHDNRLPPGWINEVKSQTSAVGVDFQYDMFLTITTLPCATLIKRKGSCIDVFILIFKCLLKRPGVSDANSKFSVVGLKLKFQHKYFLSLSWIVTLVVSAVTVHIIILRERSSYTTYISTLLMLILHL